MSLSDGNAYVRMDEWQYSNELGTKWSYKRIIMSDIEYNIQEHHRRRFGHVQRRPPEQW